MISDGEEGLDHRFTITMSMYHKDSDRWHETMINFLETITVNNSRIGKEEMEVVKPRVRRKRTCLERDTTKINN